MTEAERLSKRLAKKPSASRHEKIWNCRLAELRDGLRLSLQDVAKATGVSIATLNRAEHGCEVQLMTALSVARFFGYTVEEMWKAVPNG